VAKQAADIILTDDNFSAIVNGIIEGRLMFENIKKLMAYVLIHAFPEVWGVFIYYVFGFPVGLTSLQVRLKTGNFFDPPPSRLTKMTKKVRLENVLLESICYPESGSRNRFHTSGERAIDSSHQITPIGIIVRKNFGFKIHEKITKIPLFWDCPRGRKNR
jgi:hypothetical protein